MTSENKHLRRIWLPLNLASCLFVLLFSMVPVLSAQASQATESTHATAEDPGALPTITLSDSKGNQATVTAADIATMPRHTITAFNAHTQVKETYGGVLLSDLLAKLHAPLGKDLHGKGLSMYVIADGADHYTAVYSLAEMDPAFHPGSVLVADSLNGQVLPPKQGPLQLVNTEDKRPARWVRQLVAIRLVTTE